MAALGCPFLMSREVESKGKQLLPSFEPNYTTPTAKNIFLDT